MKTTSTRSLMTINPSQMTSWRQTYRQHKLKVDEIQMRHKIYSKNLKDEQQRIAQALRRSKETARKFKKEEDQAQRLDQDRKMVLNLIEITKKPRIRSQIKNANVKLETLPSRSTSGQKPYAKQKVSQQNKRLATSIISSSCNIKKYKKKLKSQIAQYIKIRTHLLKLKPLEQAQQKPKQKKKKKKDRQQILIKHDTQNQERMKSQAESNLPEIKAITQKQTLGGPL